MRIVFGVNGGADPENRTNLRAGKPDMLLYADEDIVVAVKPSGIPTTPAKNCARDIISVLLTAHPELDSTTLKPVHRLDRPVGGILLMTRSPRAERFFSPVGAKQSMEKRYTAVVCGRPQIGHGTLHDLILPDRLSNLSRIVGEGTKGAVEALLYYETVEEITLPDSNPGTVLDIRLLTGRRHQIRAQMAHAGCPIWGDSRYGGTVIGEHARVALFAHQLVITHPATRKQMIFRADPVLFEPDAFAVLRKEEKEGRND